MLEKEIRKMHDKSDLHYGTQGYGLNSSRKEDRKWREQIRKKISEEEFRKQNEEFDNQTQHDPQTPIMDFYFCLGCTKKYTGDRNN
jgi:hypothetical protein